MLFQFNSYQQHVYLTSANGISAWVYGGVNKVTSYFHLHDINSDLQMRNALLENEVVGLKRSIRNYQLQCFNDSTGLIKINSGFDFVMADVINNSVSKKYNFITLNKGKLDGVKPEMGIVDQNGVVGIVNVVGDHSARAISLLNPNFRLSCKVKNYNYFGSLVWNGEDPSVAILEEMPRHIKFHRGDTVITSGYSAVFPEGLIVGTIVASSKSSNDNFHSFKVKLSTDFSQLSTVRILKSNNKAEIDTIEVDNTQQ